MTRCRWAASTAGLIALLVCGAADARAQSTSDSKLWAGAVGKAEITPKLRVDVEQQVRVGSNQGYERTLTEVGGRLRVNKRVRLGAHYRLVFTDGSGTWHRVGGDLQLSHRVAKTTLSYRLRLQTTSRDDGTRTYVRNRLRAKYRMSRKLEPFAAFEIHYLTTNSEFREARGYLGVDYEIGARTALGGFYMYQSEFNKMISETNHIIGIGLEYRFRRARRGKR